MAKKVIVALHGFLGSPQDWSLIQSGLSLDWICPDYFNIPELQPQKFSDWVVAFKKWLDSNLDHNHENILMGYSLGGRLALHFILQEPHYFQKAIFLSTGLGLTDEAQKVARIISDQQWAQDFQNLNWDDVIQKWNAQGVFQGAVVEPKRFEDNYDKTVLAAALTQWSLAHQEDLSQKIHQIQIPTLWCAGAKDKKYSELIQVVQNKLMTAQTQIIPEVGHRLLLEAPEEVSNLLQDYLK